MKKKASTDQNAAGESEPPLKKQKFHEKTVVKKGELNLKNPTPENWPEFKKQKKELKLKRKQSRAKDGFDVIVRAKKIGEDLRRKSLKGGEQRRNQLIIELHTLLKGKGHYPKFGLAHDTARLVQWLLKYSSDIVIEQIADELTPAIVEMMQSKYGIFCIRRLLKYGNSRIRSNMINAMQGNVIKLASNVVSAPVLEYAFSTWANSTQKQRLIQEFYGDLYKNTKDDSVKTIKDVYKNDPSLKVATLGATKANLIKILNKNLLDSGLVQTVLSQFLAECNEDDKKDLLSQLLQHIVIISNSRDGARVAMQCIWNGTNKDKKIIMKTMKEHIVELSKHEHGHSVVITLLDSIDDTVLLNKLVLNDILKSAKDLALNEFGRKVLLWLIAPGDKTFFHPVFVNELNKGREGSTSKKSCELRQKEILEYSIETLLNLVVEDASFWLKNASLGIEMNAILKAGTGDLLKNAYDSVVEVVTYLDWKIKENEKEILGIEHSGMHMVLKKLAQNDKVNAEKNVATFGECLTQKLSDELLEIWLKTNRGCFLLVSIIENNSEQVGKQLKDKLNNHVKFLKKQDGAGAKVLLKKILNKI